MHLTLTHSNTTYILYPDEIICLQASSNYTRFYLLGNRMLLSAKCLKYYAHLLEGSDFCRVHKSYLINKLHIKKLSLAVKYKWATTSTFTWQGAN